MARETNLEAVMTTFLVVFTAAAGIGLLAWLLVTVAQMATAAAATAGAGGLGLTIKLGKGGKR